MASISKRGPYQWRVRITRKGYPPQSKTFESHADAQAWASTVESEMVRGIFISRIEAEHTTLKDALKRYEHEVTRQKRGPQPEHSRINSISKHTISHMYLANIRGKNIASFRDDLITQRLSPSTVCKYLAILSHLFNTARKEWGLEGLHNPVADVKKPLIRNGRTRRLEGNEEKQLIRSCKQRRNIYLAPMVIFAIETAMRKGEILELTWEHINLKLSTAHLPRTKNYDSRTVPLSDVATQVLTSLPHSIKGYVFNISDYASRKAFGLACKKSCDDEGNPSPILNLTFHDLRHEAVSRLAEIFPAHELAKISGHKDLKMLLRYYHPRAEDLALKMNRRSK